MIRTDRRSRIRRGAATLEAVLVIPLLVYLLFGAFEYGVIVLVEEAVENAAHESAREAALVPNDLTINPTYWDDVQLAVIDTVDTILGVFGMFDLGAPNSGVMVIVEDSTHVACLGDATVAACPLTTTITDPGEIQVTVYVTFTAARIPNFLSIVGLDLSTRRFEVRSICRKQT